MLRSKLALGVLAATALVAPVSADEAEWAGFTCGFASTNDPTGLVEQNPNVQTGEMDCGPWTAVDFLDDDADPPAPSSSAGAHTITITGTIQVNQELYGGAAAAKATCSGTNSGVVYTACVISYEALPTDNVYLCTHVSMKDQNNVEYTFTFDEDDVEANGNQCSLATSVG